MLVVPGWVPTSRRTQTLGWRMGPKALKNQRCELIFLALQSIDRGSTSVHYLLSPSPPFCAPLLKPSAEVVLPPSLGAEQTGNSDSLLLLQAEQDLHGYQSSFGRFEADLVVGVGGGGDCVEWASEWVGSRKGEPRGSVEIGRSRGERIAR